MQQQKLLRPLLETIEAGTPETSKVNLSQMEPTTSLGVEQLRKADLIDETFHDTIGGLPIEGMPWLTLKGQQYLEELRWRWWRKVISAIGVFWAAVTGASSIVSGLYYLYHLHS